MDRKFKYLSDKYTEIGARKVFENICLSLLQSLYGTAYSVLCYPGDDGIDAYVNNITDPNSISVYQCKYFTERIGDTQKTQIKYSFDTLMNSIHKDRVKNWFLCIPTTLISSEHDWWLTWSNAMSQKYSISITLYDENILINLLRQTNLYSQYFDVIEVDSLMFSDNQKSKYIEQLLPVITEVANNDFEYSTPDFILACDLIVIQYQYDPFFVDSNLIVAIDYLREIISFNVQNNKIESKEIISQIRLIRDSILSEYYKLFYPSPN